MIKKIFGIIFNPWVLLVLGLLALSLVIWIVGPLVAIGNWRPLESTTARWVFIGLIVLLIVLRNVWKLVASRKKNDKVVDQLLAPAAADAGDGELKTLNERFTKALETLKTAKFEQPQGGLSGLWNGLSSRLGKRYLYELPWYVIIGAPGSGKTTALVNSGLNFPLATSGEHAIKGVGGTRNCDWWFTDQAVLIDTAGRYTTQDSHKDTDAKAWEGFLGLLKRSRPRQPVNGVLVTVSVTDLLTQSAAERKLHAATVRARLQELHQHLGLRFPIYLLVTKSDLLAGFMETLGDVDKDTRAAPWGFTFKLDKQQRTDFGTFSQEFDALEQRLTNGLVGKLQLERDPQRRARIYGFPQQFEALKGLLKDYLDQVFSPSQFEANPLLRGVYFVSGTQEGTPIDRMLGRIARTYRLERTVVPPNQSSGKSYFLPRLLKEVVFSESGLAGTDVKWERRRGLFAMGAYALIGVLAAVTLTAWGISYFGNQRYVDKVGTAVEEVKKLVQATPNRNSPDVLVLLPALEATRDLAKASIGESVPWSLGFGLYQGKKLDAASKQAYRRMLIDAVLPRIALGIEEQLKTGNDNPELQYEALKAYVMLYDPERFDPAALKLYVTADWELTLPRSVTTEQRAALESHLDALLAEGAVVSPLPEDKALVTQTRTRLVATPLTERIYRRMKRQGFGAEFPEFTVAKVAGAGAALVFTRASGQPLTKGVSGVFTNDGYHKGFQREVERVAGHLADEESWVLGVTDSNRQNALKNMDIKLQLNDEVRRLYLSEYAKTWEEFIADIKMVKTSNLAQAVQMARVLSAPDNPLVPLLKAMSRETTLRESKDVAGKVETTKARDALQRSREELSRLLGNKSSGSAVEPGQAIESIVDDRFVGLRQMVSSPDGKLPAPVDGTVALINEVYTLLTAADTAVKGGNVPPPSEVPNKVKAEAARLPEPVRSLLNTLSVSGTSAALEITRSNLGNAINSEIGEFCRAAIAGRYPFARGSSRDATQEDFARVFGPGGLFDTFFQKNLVNYVDTSSRPWRFKSVDGASMGTDSSTLLQFQHAAMIRETFFRGGPQVGVRLDFKPVEMDATITQFILDVDGQLVKYGHGPQIPTSVQWPGPRGSSQVRVQVTPVSASGASGLVTDGPWALFKIFDKQQIEPSGAPERWKATFNVDGRKASFQVTTSSVRNPFRLPELEQFSCPGKL